PISANLPFAAKGPDIGLGTPNSMESCAENAERTGKVMERAEKPPSLSKFLLFMMSPCLRIWFWWVFYISMGKRNPLVAHFWPITKMLSEAHAKKPIEANLNFQLYRCWVG